MVEVHCDGRATRNQRFIDGSVVCVLAIELLIPSDIDCTTVVGLVRHLLVEAQLTGVTPLEPGVIVHAQWSDVPSG